MTNEKSSPENAGDAAPEDAEQELLEHRDLQDAQIVSMMHIWDNPEDDRWTDVPSVGEVVAPIASEDAARPAQLSMAERRNAADPQ